MKTDNTLLGVRLGCSGLVLLFCIGIAAVIIKLKPETETRDPKEAVLVAELIEAKTQDVVVTLTAHGIARPTRMVTLSSEVAGRVIGVHDRLEEGDRVAKGQTLVEIDPKDFQAAVREGEASLARIDASLERLNATESTTKAQLEVSKRSRDLAKADFDRLSRLSKQGNTVSQAVAEAAERSLAQAEGQVLQLEQTLELLPSQRAEAESEKEAAVARLDQIQTQLERTQLKAPFDGRIVTSMVEKDSYLAPGSPILQVADDRELEIRIPLQAAELRKWIPFADSETVDGWFPPLRPTEVTIEWTGSEKGVQWTGSLDRVVSFDATTRTAMLAVRVSGEHIYSDQDGFPLTDGMFCRVSIPGKTLSNVISLPREAVSFDNEAFLSVDGRLQTTTVTVGWSTDETAYITEGINAGDLVVGTRLVAPMEGVIVKGLED